MSIAALFPLLTLYFVLLFWIARWSTSKTTMANKVKNSGVIYSLSLAVYCTSWTYYGNIGQATGQGINHVALFLGSTLVYVFFSPLLKRMIRIKNHYHSTSIADFISARYNNSYTIAALISLFCLIGIIPYISIQFKAVFSTVSLLTNNQLDDVGLAVFFEWLIVLLVIVFTIIFGVRKLDPTERHPGMMVALAAEAIFKIVAFLAAAIFICFYLYNSPFEIINQAQSTLPETSALLTPPNPSGWFASMFIGIVGVLALPRQFHVGVVECSNEKLIDSARWQFPLYLMAINILVIPIAMAGKMYLESGYPADLVLLEIPLQAGYGMIAILIFLGGFAAATGMIMVSAMTLSTMVTNHIVVPLLEYSKPLQFMNRYLLYIRWAVVAGIILLSLKFYGIIGDSALLVKIGSISFIAVAQLLPLLLGAILWEKASLHGAIAGIIGGAMLWAYTSLLPALIGSGWLETDILQTGLFSQPWLRPQSLFGLSFESSTAHSLFFSLVFNCSLFFWISSISNRSLNNTLEHAREFIRIGEGEQQKKRNITLPLDIPLQEKYNTLLALFCKYLTKNTATDKLERYFNDNALSQKSNVNILQLSKLCADATGLLAGIIGMASASRAITKMDLINDIEREQLKYCYSQLLAQSQLTPEELLDKVDYYQDRQRMLEDHAKQQEQIIAQLKKEQSLTNLARKELKVLNDELENRVLDRTSELFKANTEISKSLEKLRAMQHQLVQADRMASLGSLVAGVAHEINTPVGTMMTALSKLKEDYLHFEQRYITQQATKNDMDTFLIQILNANNIALDNVNKTANLVNSFKQVAVDLRFEDLRTFSLHDLLHSTGKELKSQHPEVNLTTDIKCDIDITLHSYPEVLSKVFSCLTLNTIIHGYKGQAVGNSIIEVRQTSKGLRIEYSDKGIGLTDEGKENFFEPFYTTIRGEGGSGLGGHIIYNLITQTLKGDVILEKSYSTGFKIVVTLPLDIIV